MDQLADKMEAELESATASGDLAELTAACAKVHGTASFREHLSPSVVAAAEKALTKAKLLGSFRAFDVDGDDSLDAKELKAILQRGTGKSMRDEDVQAIIDAFDKNSDGKLQLDEFVEAMTALDTSLSASTTNAATAAGDAP